MAVIERYDRQARIEGWDQERLEKSTLAIVGQNAFSEYLALASSALGIGAVRIISTQDYKGEECGLLTLSNANTREERLADMIRKVGNSRMEYVRGNMKSAAEEWFLSGADAVVDATGRNESRALCLNYTEKAEIAHFYDKGFALYTDGNDMRALREQKASYIDPVSAMIAAGAALEEVKKGIFGRRERDSAYYDFPNISGKKEYPLRALVVGAGALGNFVVAGLAYLGLEKVDIMDPDAVDETNLNRQILFYGAVGEKKAKVLAERCSQISGRKYNAVTERFDNDTKMSYDIVLDCVDNFQTRLLLSEKCTGAGIPLVSGGTSYSAGQVVAYVPKKTSCPNHVLDLDTAAKKREHEMQGAGCILQPDPSVIMTNEVTAGMMLNELRRIVYGNAYGQPTNGQLRYEANGMRRFGAIRLEEKCGD